MKQKKTPLAGSSTTKNVKTTRPKSNSKLSQMRSQSPFPTGSSTSFVPGQLASATTNPSIIFQDDFQPRGFFGHEDFGSATANTHKQPKRQPVQIANGQLMFNQEQEPRLSTRQSLNNQHNNPFNFNELLDESFHEINQIQQDEMPDFHKQSTRHMLKQQARLLKKPKTNQSSKPKIRQNQQLITSIDRNSMHQTMQQTLTQAAINHHDSNDVVISIPITENLQQAIRNSLRMGAACQRLQTQIIKTSQLYKKFQHWKMHQISWKHGMEPILQTKVQNIEYSMSQSILGQENQDALRRLMSSIMRFKSRRMAKCFWTWQLKTTQTPQHHQILTHSSRPKTSHKTQDSDVQDLMNRYKFLAGGSLNDQSSRVEHEVDENLSNNSGCEEKAIPKETKQTFDQAILAAGPTSQNKPAKSLKRPLYSFKADDVEPSSETKRHPLEYYNVLQSKNKDFGQIVATSESQSEIGIPSVNPIQILQRAKAIFAIKKSLERPLRKAVKKWLYETEACISEVTFKLRQKQLYLQRMKVLALITLKVTNERAIMRSIFQAFGRWRTETMIESRALDSRQSQFLINNAKLEVQKSKTALQTLYKIKVANSGMEIQAQRLLPQQSTLSQLGQAASIVFPPEKSPIDTKRLKGQVKQMCFDMLLSILKEADSGNQDPAASMNQSQMLLQNSIQRLNQSSALLQKLEQQNSVSDDS